MNKHHSLPVPSNTTVQHTVRRLIHDIKDLGLETGRNLSYEELRTLPLEPQLIDRVLRQVAEARTIDDVVANLESFATTLQQSPRSRLHKCLTSSLQRLKDLRSYLCFSSRA
ncbi:MAG: hypothetical protein AB7G75_22675 [Candidatus Binatia bacterium]